MPSRPVGVADTATASTVAEIDVVERPSPDIVTITTADPGASGTTLAVNTTSTYKFGQFPTVNGFKVRVEAEVMLVTAGAGTGSWTVTRAQDGTTGVAHTTGVTVAQVVGVQRVEPVDGSRIVTYKGRAQTFRTPGRAGTAGQKILSIHNATGSAVKVRINKAWVDKASTVVIAVTVLPPIIRMWKVTVLPTNGTALTKVPMDSSLSSSSSVTVLGDASADGTGSVTTLTATLPAGTIITQEFAARLITAAGYEPFDRETFLDSDSDFVTLNALEGIVIFLDYVLATQNATTEMWISGVEWEEFTVS